MRRCYPDQRDEKQYTNCGSLLAVAEAIYPEGHTELSTVRLKVMAAGINRRKALKSVSD